MSFYRHFLLRSLRRPLPRNPSPSPLPLSRSFAFSSAEEAAAERRRRKRQLRIEPPLHFPRGGDPNAPPPSRPPRDPRLPDSTSDLVGSRLVLHNRVQLLIRTGNLDDASATARKAVFSSPRPTVFTCNAVLSAMLRARRLDDAVAHFHFFFQQSNIVPNVVSYNYLINTHCEAGRVDDALEIYRHILATAPFSPSHVTYRHLTRGLVEAGRLPEGIDLLREMLNRGHGADSFVYNNLIDGYIKKGNMEKALELFDELRERCLVYDGVVHATLMEAYFQKGMEKEAMASYKQLMDRHFQMNAVTCNTLLEVLLKYGKSIDALTLFNHMVIAHLPPSFVAVNTDSYNIMVNAYCRQRKFAEAIGIFRKRGKKPCVMDVGCYNNIIGKLCAEEGWVEEAEKLFDEMTSRSLNHEVVRPDATTYGFLINGYFREGKSNDALRYLAKMVSANVEAGLKVDMGLYSNLIGELVEKGRLEEAVGVLGTMMVGRVMPEPVSYESVVMALCNEGKLDKVRYLLEEMPRSDVAFSPALHEAVLNAFAKEGLREEVERLLQQKEQQGEQSVVPSASAAFPASSSERFEQVAA